MLEREHHGPSPASLGRRARTGALIIDMEFAGRKTEEGDISKKSATSGSTRDSDVKGVI